MKDVIVFTADDEEPICHRCDNMEASDEFCQKCGENFWAGYQRTELKERIQSNNGKGHLIP